MKHYSYRVVLVILVATIIAACGIGGDTNKNDTVITIGTPQLSPKLKANAGPAQSGSIGKQFILDGSASFSDDKNASITYQWSFQTVPDNNESILSHADTDSPSFIPNKTGSYVIKLIIQSGELVSAPATVNIEVFAPVANAGTNQTISTGIEVVLDGGKSTYKGSEPLIYNWSLDKKPTGSVSAVLLDSSVVKTSFIPDVDGDYEIALFVSNSIVDSSADTVTITATTVPVSHAGDDQTVSVGTTVQLDGTGSSTTNNYDLIYQWKLKKKPLNSLAILSDVSSATPTVFTDKKGDYLLTLVVDNGLEKSLADDIKIAAIPPTANAGENQTVSTSATVKLNASASEDVSLQQLLITWTIIKSPEESSTTLSNINAIESSFVADKEGEYIVGLTVDNGTISSDQDTIKVNAVSPIANAGDDQKIITGSTVTLDASRSVSGITEALTYSWSLLSKPEDSVTDLDNSKAEKPVFIAEKDGTYEFQLIVNNGLIDSNVDKVQIVATTLPIANTGDDLTISVNQSVILDGAGSRDSNDSDLIYQWKVQSQPQGALSELSDSLTATPTFVTDLPGDYEIALIVNNTVDNSAADILTITTKIPIANAGPGHNVTPNTNVMLNGSDSLNVDDSKTGLTYLWSLENFPIGTVATISDPTLSSPTFMPDELGSYQLCLTVNNTFIDSESACLMINARISVGSANGIFSANFENPNDNALWGIDSGTWGMGEPISGPNIAYIGHNVLATVLDGNYPDTSLSIVSSVTIQLPEISVGEEINFSFWHWFSFHPGKHASQSSFSFDTEDYGVILISEETGSGERVWTSLDTIKNNSGGNWNRYNTNISAFSGKSVRIGFQLVNTCTNAVNTYYCVPRVAAGWYIDELIIEKTN